MKNLDYEHVFQKDQNQGCVKLWNFDPLGTSDESELSSARIQLELEDFQLGSARGIFEPARVLEILPERAVSAPPKNGWKS